VTAQRFVGSQVAEMDLPRNHPLTPYVGSYRDHVERRAIDSLKQPDTSKQMKDGVPHTFGTQTISHADLSHAKDVQIVTIDSRTYQKAWVDGALVIVPQASSSSAGTPDGGKKLQLAPEVKNQTKPSTPVKPINRKKN